MLVRYFLFVWFRSIFSVMSLPVAHIKLNFTPSVLTTGSTTIDAVSVYQTQRVFKHLSSQEPLPGSVTPGLKKLQSQSTWRKQHVGSIHFKTLGHYHEIKGFLAQKWVPGNFSCEACISKNSEGRGIEKKFSGKFNFERTGKFSFSLLSVQCSS